MPPKFLNELKAETDDWGVATQYYHSRNPSLGQAYAGRVTLNGSGKLISNIGPVKPLSAEEKAALGDEVPDHMAAADELIAKARAARQPKTRRRLRSSRRRRPSRQILPRRRRERAAAGHRRVGRRSIDLGAARFGGARQQPLVVQA